MHLLSMQHLYSDAPTVKTKSVGSLCRAMHRAKAGYNPNLFSSGLWKGLIVMKHLFWNGLIHSTPIWNSFRKIKLKKKLKLLVPWRQHNIVKADLEQKPEILAFFSLYFNNTIGSCNYFSPNRRTCRLFRKINRFPSFLKASPHCHCLPGSHFSPAS